MSETACAVQEATCDCWTVTEVDAPKMPTLTVKLLVAFACFSTMHLSTEAAKFNTCRANAATLPCIPGLPGKDGQPGRDGTDGEQGPAGAQGPPGLPGVLNYTEQQS